MSDLWPFSSTPPPIIHRSSPSQSSPFSSLPPPLSSSPSPQNHPQVTSLHLGHHTQVSSPPLVPHTQVTSPHLGPHTQVTSPHLGPHTQVSSPPLVPHTQVSSPHLGPHAPMSSPPLVPHTQVTSPHLGHYTQMSSPPLGPHTQVSSPPLVPHTQVTSPHLGPHTQVSSTHLVPHTQVTSPHLGPHTQVSSTHLVPHTQVTSPHLGPHTQVTSPHLCPHTQVSSPHLGPHTQVSSPPLGPHTQVTSPHLGPHTQVSSPHLGPHTQVTSPHLGPHTQVTSPYLGPHTQVSSPNLGPHTQVSSPPLVPHTQVTSPHLGHYTQMSSPHLGPHTQVSSPPLVPHTQVTSPHLGPHTQVSSPHLGPHTQMSSPHLGPHNQMSSPHLGPHTQVSSPPLGPHTQISSPHLGPHTQMSSPHLGHHTQVSSPHLGPHTQVSSPHLGPHTQVSSPHLGPHTQVSSPHLGPHTQMSSPHLGPHTLVSTPHLGPHSQVSSPHLGPHTQVTAPHLLYPHQHHLYNHDPGLDHPDWSRAEPPSELPNLLRSYSYQNQTAAHLDLQNQFSPSGTHHQDELENTYRLPYNTHAHLASGSYAPGDPSGPGQGTWRPTPPQLQWPPQGTVTGGVAQGRWSSSSAEDFSSTQFFHDIYHDDYAPQPFCSPTTPGPSPHYPQAPAFSSLGPQMHPGTERLDFQTSRQLSRDETLSCCLNEYDSYLVTSDPGQHHLHQTVGHLLRRELIQDQPGCFDTTESCFSPQRRGRDVSSAAQSPVLSAGRDWREKSGGGGGGGGGGGSRGAGGGGNRGGRRRGGGDTQKVKQPQPENITQLQKSRLLCTVCKRDFRSLPALNGHMRSHSGSRSATWLNKSEDPSPVVQPSVSIVLPVSVPVQSRRPRRCRRPNPAGGGEVPLYRSLLHQEEEEDEDGKAGDGKAGHYTPPPMLCPLRAGPGLYCSLAARRRPRIQTVRLDNNHQGLSDLVAIVTVAPPPRTLINKPRINEGQPFQAEIPPMQVRKDADCDSHNARLLWTPRDELDCPISQQRVEALLTMVRSSVVPGGGACPEFVLDVLSECRGDFLLTVEKLLSTPETSDNNHTAQRHPIVSWSAAERRLLVKSLQLHQKDFSRIQKAVRTKSVSQCVEFYYLWKRKLSLSAGIPAGLTVSLADTNG